VDIQLCPIQALKEAVRRVFQACLSTLPQPSPEKTASLPA
jgi:hypothetical protein